LSRGTDRLKFRADDLAEIELIVAGLGDEALNAAEGCKPGGEFLQGSAVSERLLRKRLDHRK
jgi:hypothetical protein